MNSCTFFGHSDAPSEILPVLYDVITDLITNKNVRVFYVGVEGNYDRLCYRILKDLENEFTFIKIYRVLAYYPKDNTSSVDSIFPEGIERVPKRVAISYRNKWMIEKSNYAVTYVVRTIGGAYKFENIAIKRGLNVINISRR